MVKNEFALFTTKRFVPLFITQFLGAFNDNLFKTALIMLLAFSPNPTPFNRDTLINICAGLFILPFFLFSAFAGQLADKFEKSNLIVWTKAVELIVAVFAIIGFFRQDLILLLISLFLLGTQATFFGPLKYSILPQHLKDHELVGGNGLIGMGTFIAILLGTILGGLLMSIDYYGALSVSVLMGLIALFGFISSFFIPKANSCTTLILDLNPIRQTKTILKETYQHPIVFRAIFCISWFWFFGSMFLTQTPNFTRIILKGGEEVATMLLTSFTIGIGIGAAASEWLSNKKIELGFSLLGLCGLTLFGLDLALTPYLLPEREHLTVLEFLSHLQNLRILTDGFLLGISGGIYIIPLYSLIQKMSANEIRSRMIAANNIYNAILMVLASVVAIVFLNVGFSIPQLFIFTVFLNILMGFYLYNLNKLYQKVSLEIVDSSVSFSE